MFEYIEGKITDLNPAYAVIETGQIGWLVNITLATFSKLQGSQTARLYLQQIIREDAHWLYGFYDKEEREMFRHLINVSGIGAATARLVLSSLSAAELKQAILTADIVTLKSVKGIGQKSAERLIVELRDKLGKISSSEDFLMTRDNRLREEAFTALVTLGFPRAAVEKVLDKIQRSYPEKTGSLEDLIKQALREL